MAERVTLTLGDAESVRDLDTFIDRAGSIENEAVRLIADGTVLTVAQNRRTEVAAWLRTLERETDR